MYAIRVIVNVYGMETYCADGKPFGQCSYQMIYEADFVLVSIVFIGKYCFKVLNV